MKRVVLVHWNEAECAERAKKLAAAGFRVESHWRQDGGSALTRSLREDPPAAVVIDLGRLPSHGRAIATWVRERKALRPVPLVFVPGDAEKTDRLRAAFPDAVYATWGRMKTALPKAIANPPRDPVVPAAADYSGTPLPRKLGLQAGGRLSAVRAPRDFGGRLGELPERAAIVKRLAGELDVIVLFCTALAELRADWKSAVRCLADRGSLWIAWPKRASGRTTDLSDGVVRAFGLDQGLVDTKVCAIDETWSGLRFSRRRTHAR
jgi:CheY-like chemotaxis protein